MSEWLSVGEVAGLLGVSIPTIRRWDRSGRLRARRDPTSGHRRFAAADVRAFASARPESSAADVRSMPALIGRQRELLALRELLEPGIVASLLGTGGIGKTTLALALAASHAGSVRFVDLTEAESLEQARERVADALGARADDLGRSLERSGDSLVILDNVEQLLPAIANEIAAWSLHAPAVAWLVTSRERLRLKNERVFELEPLPVPDAGERQPERIFAMPSVELFRRRADAVGAPIAAEDALAVAEIARRLEGLPLALELAAARARLLSISELARALEKQLGLLTRGSREGPARHATLSATIEWSWSLLDETERSALAQCSVFRGGFALEAAAAVLEIRGDWAAIDLLDALESKSLLRRQPSKNGVRFDLFVAIREFAAERLAKMGAVDDTRRHHLRHFAELAVAHAADPGSASIEVAKELSDELENLREAHAAALAFEPKSAVILARALERLLTPRVSVLEVLELVDRTLALADEVWDGSVLALRVARGRLLSECGRLEESERELERALAGARASEDRTLEAYVLSLMAIVEVMRGRPEQALAFASDAALDPEPSDARARTLWAHRASVLHETGHEAEAAASYERALAAARAQGDTIFEARMWGRLGRVFAELGRYADAESAFTRSLEVLGQADDRYEAWVIAHRACARRLEDRLDSARVAYQDALELFDDFGFMGAIPLHRAHLAQVCADLGRVEDAFGWLTRARAPARVEYPMLGRILELAEASVELARGRRAKSAGDRDAALRARDQARDRLEEARGYWSFDKDLRLAIRSLERAIARFDSSDDLPAWPPLVIAGDGSWLTPPDGDRARLTPGGPAARLLMALVHAHVNEPGRFVSSDELVASAWPDEKILPQPALQRLHTAVAQLRATGLSQIETARNGGYRIAPAAAIRLEPP